MSEICTMSILVIAATEMEIRPFLSKNKDIKYLITGVGAYNATYLLTREILKSNYTLIIQVGIAGTFNKNRLLGESVFIEKDCFADVGVLAKNNFENIFDINLANANEFPFKEGYLVNKNIKQIVTNGIQFANGITVNLISDNENYINQLQTKYEAEIETMEGAALHYVCLKENILFLQIRGISNYVGERDKSKWKIEEAITSSNQVLYAVLNDHQKNN